MQRLLFGLYLTLGTVFSAQAQAQAQELRVALGASAAQIQSVSEVGAPGFREQGLNAVSGELVREICRRINARCRFDYLLFSEILPAMVAKRYEIAAGNFIRTPEREKMVNFSDAIATSSSRLLASPERAAVFSGKVAGLSLKTLRDARVVVLAGSVQQEFVKSIAVEQRLTVLSVASTTEILSLLRKGEADFWLTPVYLAYSAIGGEPPGKYQFYGPPEVANGLGGSVHIALTKNDEDLTAQVNKALAELRADGTYHRIVRQYFPVSLD